MSVWTHVSGIIRVDGMGFVTGHSPTDERKELERILGITVKFDSPPDGWDRCSIPYGSEGSIQYKVDIHGGDHSLYRGAGTIWGDLRNYDNVNEVGEWFKDVIDQIEKDSEYLFGIRDAVMAVEVESELGNKVIYVWDGEKIVKKEVRE